MTRMQLWNAQGSLGPSLVTCSSCEQASSRCKGWIDSVGESPQTMDKVSVYIMLMSCSNPSTWLLTGGGEISLAD